MRNISVVVYHFMYSVDEVAIALLRNDNNIEDVPKSKLRNRARRGALGTGPPTHFHSCHAKP